MAGNIHKKHIIGYFYPFVKYYGLIQPPLAYRISACYNLFTSLQRALQQAQGEGEI
jgi:hypothetical protein